MTDKPLPAARRPLTSRNSVWAQHCAAWLAARRVSPDLISALSIVFAGAGAAALCWLTDPLGPLLCALGIQLRLVCNLLDGMVAVEGGRGGATGPLWNELPDRLADTLLILALGVVAGHAWLGWLGALLAALTAYVRVTGGALGLAQDFSGLQSKPRRMALMTVACVLAALIPDKEISQQVLLIASTLVALGSAITCASRARAIANALRARAAAPGEEG